MASAVASPPACTRCGVVGHSATACPRPFFRPECTHCRKMGHTVSDCYMKRRAEQDERQRRAQLDRDVLRSISRNACVCWKCGESGHLKANCNKQLVVTKFEVVLASYTDKDSDAHSDSTRATMTGVIIAREQGQPGRGERFDAAVTAAAAAADVYMACASTFDTRSNIGSSSSSSTRDVAFGRNAFAPMRPHVELNAGKTCGASEAEVANMVRESVAGVATMRGQRGEKSVTEMMVAWCSHGLFMHGPPASSLNSMIIPAIRHIISEMAKLPPQHTKRVDCLSTLAYACQDCQQVQAREILRIFGDLTAQSATLEGQLMYSLLRLKEVALNCYISRMHPKCDAAHTNVSPWQQRAHLWSAYVVLIGESFGLDGITAAKSDRFLSQAQAEIVQVDAKVVVGQLRRDLSVEEWLRMLLADINNQAEGAERLIDRDCIFKWAQTNMTSEKAHSVFYDEDRDADYADQDPRKPTQNNLFQPFLSRSVLVSMLKVAVLLRS